MTCIVDVMSANLYTIKIYDFFFLNKHFIVLGNRAFGWKWKKKIIEESIIELVKNMFNLKLNLFHSILLLISFNLNGP